MTALVKGWNIRDAGYISPIPVLHFIRCHYLNRLHLEN
jgi:hypothetical protein